MPFIAFLTGIRGTTKLKSRWPIKKKRRPFGTFAYRRMPLGLCGTFSRCMMGIFSDMIEKIVEVFMDDFLVFGNSFESLAWRTSRKFS